MKDSEIRVKLLEDISKRYSKKSDALIIEELGIRHGLARVDVAVLADHLIGYEIKSDSDSLRRLPGQIDIYNTVFKEMNLIVGYKLAGSAINIVPPWWGIKLVHRENSGKLLFQTARLPKLNPGVDKTAVLKLLWKKEATEFLRYLNVSFKIQGRERLYQMISQATTEATIYSYLQSSFKCRSNWRAVELQK